VFGPLVAAYAQVEVSGRETLDAISGPAVLVANHASHVDTPILLGALPPGRRGHTLVGAAADYFYVRRSLAVAVSLCFGTVPIHRSRETGDGGQGGAGTPVSGDLDALERLVRAGFSLVLFAEGTRTRTGRLGEFRPGAAALAARCEVPLVPVHIGGTSALMGPGHGWMARADRAGVRRRRVTVDFGAPLRPGRSQAAPATMADVRRFMAAHGGG
jgi:1-acyl-sn-glycerol-3-phosphate acyltransferase